MPNGSSNKVTFTVSYEALFRILLVVAGVWFLWIIHDIVALIFVCLILASALNPTIDFLRRYRIPRAVGTILIYVLVISLFTSIIIAISGPIATEVKNLALQVPKYYDELNKGIVQLQTSNTNLFTADRIQNFRGGLDDLLANLTKLASGNAFTAISAIFGSVFSVMLALVITFYFVMEENAIRNFITWIVPRGREQESVMILDKIQIKLGMWLRGQVLLSLIIFIVTYVGLKILGVEYALVLALLAGLLEVVPYLGPVLGAIPAIFLTLMTGGWFKALLVLILYIVIQQLENNLIVPKVMSRTVGLNPLVVIVAILIGAELSGIVGALMAVPVATAVAVFLEEKGYKKELVV